MEIRKLTATATALARTHTLTCLWCCPPPPLFVDAAVQVLGVEGGNDFHSHSGPPQPPSVHVAGGTLPHNISHFQKLRRNKMQWGARKCGEGGEGAEDREALI